MTWFVFGIYEVYHAPIEEYYCRQSSCWLEDTLSEFEILTSSFMQVVELLIRKLEGEPSFHRKVDLFFLVDSITQCSHNQKGICTWKQLFVIIDIHASLSLSHWLWVLDMDFLLKSVINGNYFLSIYRHCGSFICSDSSSSIATSSRCCCSTWFWCSWQSSSVS